MTDGTARLVVSRGGANAYAVVGWKILVDGQVVGVMRRGERSISVDVEPGSHSVRLGGANTYTLPRRVELAAGEEVRLRVPLLGGRMVLDLNDVDVDGADDALPAARTPPNLQSAPSAQDITDRVVHEVTRRESPVGEPEARTIDNSLGRSAIVRTFTVTREWTRTCTVQKERATTVSGGLTLPLAALKAEADLALREHYASTTTERQSFQDSVVVTVAPGVRSQVFFAWREIRQQGYVDLVYPEGTTRVPYELVTGITFDQQQIDE